GACRDLVAAELAALDPVVRKVLRSGEYVAHDHGHYAGLSPFPLEPALRVWSVVVSTPEPGLALLTLGKRDISYDLDLPVPLAPGLRVTALNDQHASVRHPHGPLPPG